MSIFKKIFESNDLDINEDIELNEYGFPKTFGRYGADRVKRDTGPRFYGDDDGGSKEYSDDRGASDEGLPPSTPKPSKSFKGRRSSKRKQAPKLSPEERLNAMANSKAEIALAQTGGNPEEAIGYLDLFYKNSPKDDVYEKAVEIIQSKSKGIQKERENKMKSWKEKLFESTGLGLPIMESLMNDDEWGYEEEEQEFEEEQGRTPEERQIIDKAVQDIHTDKLQVQDVLPRVPEHLRDDVLDELRRRGEDVYPERGPDGRGAPEEFEEGAMKDLLMDMVYEVEEKVESGMDVKSAAYEVAQQNGQDPEVLMNYYNEMMGDEEEEQEFEEGYLDDAKEGSEDVGPDNNPDVDVDETGVAVFNFPRFPKPKVAIEWAKQQDEPYGVYITKSDKIVAIPKRKGAEVEFSRRGDPLKGVFWTSPVSNQLLKYTKFS